MIVVDTNVIAYLFVPGHEFSGIANALHREDPVWAAPRLWRSEFRNLLAGYLRRRVLSFERVCAIQLEAESLMDADEYDVTSEDVLPLVRDSNCSAYDCEYIALALELETRLVTADRQLLRAFPALTVSLS